MINGKGKRKKKLYMSFLVALSFDSKNLIQKEFTTHKKSVSIDFQYAHVHFPDFV